MDVIENEGRNGDAEKINNAAMLLYFASGLAGNLLSQSISDVKHDENYVRIEPLTALLHRCGNPVAGNLSIVDAIIALNRKIETLL